MEANPVGIIQYFDGEKQSLIPLFQRQYTWNKNNWQTLWDDVITHYTLGTGSSHFMGALVSIPARTVPVGVTKHLIIDGQQRLTTIAVLLCALRDSKGCHSQAQGRIQDFLTNRHCDGTADHLKLLPTQADREVYSQLIIDRIVNTEHPIGQAHQFFINAIQGDDEDGEPLDYQRVFDTVTRCLQVVMINLGETDDPYLIFESLNYKGVPLTQADLVRNYILMKFRHEASTGGEQERIYRQLWQPIEASTGEHLSEFLRHYASLDGNNVKKPQVYATIKASLCDMDLSAIEKQLVEIKEFAAYYQKVIEPACEPDATVRARLQAVNQIEISVCYPLLLKFLLSYADGRITTAELCQCIDMIIYFVVRRAACEVIRAPMNRLFIRHAGKYPDRGDVVLWFRGVLLGGSRSERWPDDDEFAKALRTNKIFDTKPARVILEGLENAFAGKERVADQVLTIEHVMPQTLTDAWEALLGPEFGSVHKDLLHTLGNSTLTGYNSELGNKSFEQKKRQYQESNIAMNRHIANKSTWNRTQIEIRAEELASKALTIWTRQ